MDLTQIKAFAFDIDGVATDGGVQCTTDGDLLRTYDAKDGFAIRMASMNGFPIAVITGGSSETIRKRMIVSGVKPEDVFLHCRDKRIEFGLFWAAIHLCTPRGLAFARPRVTRICPFPGPSRWTIFYSSNAKTVNR